MENFNWYYELDNAINYEPDNCKYNYLFHLSTSWVTCACGQLCKELLRYSDNMPEDGILQTLGMIFSELIEKRDWKNARIILDDIEERTLFLIT